MSIYSAHCVVRVYHDDSHVQRIYWTVDGDRCESLYEVAQALRELERELVGAGLHVPRSRDLGLEKIALMTGQSSLDELLERRAR